MIDYCTMVVSEVERDLLSLHINSARHYLGNDLNFKVSVKPDDTDTIALCEKFNLEVLPHPTFIQMEAHPGLRQAGFDCANRMDQLMKACTSDWVILSHLDIVWKDHPMQDLYSLMTDGCGIIGSWPQGCVVVNRKVYEGCHHGFWPNGGWLGRVHFEHPMLMIQIIGNREGDNKPWWNRETGVDGDLINIDAVDVGSLLRIEMQGYGYAYNYGRVNSCHHHIGGVSFHVLTDDIVDRVQQAKKIYERFL